MKNPNWTKIIAFALLAIFLFSGFGAAASIIPTTSITVQQASGETDIPDSIVVKNASGNSLTDNDPSAEKAVYNDVPPGTYFVEVSKNGYTTFKTSVNVPDQNPPAVLVEYTLNPSPPATPTDLKAFINTQKQVALSWKDNAVGEENYVVYRNSNPLVTLGPGAQLYTDTNVVESQTYSYFVKAYDQDVNLFSAASNTVSITVILPPSNPSLAPIALKDGKPELTITDNSDNEAGFEILRQKAGNTNWELVKALPANPNTGVLAKYVDSSAADFTQYSYKARAFNSGGSTESGVEAVTTPFGVPVDLKATATASTIVQLSWKDNSAVEDGYKVFRSLDNITFTEIKSDLPANSASYADKNLTQSTKYYYKVQAFKGTNTAETAVAEATTLTPDKDLVISLGAPTEIKAGSSGEFKITVTNNGAKAEDVLVTFTVEDIAGVDFEQEIDFGELDTGKSDSESVTVNVPFGVESGSRDVTVEADWDSAGNSFSTEVASTVKITIPKHSVQISESLMSKTRLDAGDTIQVMATVQNTGSSNEDIVLRLSATDIGSTSMQITLPKGQSATNMLKLSIPETVETGAYPVILTASYSGSSVEQAFTVNVQGNEQPVVIQPIEEVSPEPKVPVWLLALIIVLAGIAAVLIALKTQRAPAAATQAYTYE